MEEGSGKALQYSYLENPTDLEDPIGLQSMGLQKSQTDLVTKQPPSDSGQRLGRRRIGF